MKLYTFSLTLTALFFSFNTIAQSKRTSIAFSVGNAPHDFRIGWYEVDNESFDDYDVEKNNFSLGIKIEYALKNNINIRFRASYLHIKFHEFQDKSVSYRSSLSQQNKFQFAPGIIFPLTRDRFTLYGGLEAIAYFHGDVATDYAFTVKDFPLHDSKGRSTIPRGFTAGAAPLMGFSFNITKIFFIEAEFSMLMTYGKMGGKTNSNQGGVLSSTQDLTKGMFTEPRAGFGVGVKW